ncbi:GGDEF domain-containing protein [Simiduia curdlanivorans]|uniref:diguanylate cyclase n=1 Tax=Simiduia curdlanivorans TaxID=1492769 RepID=A0ABV8V6U1_9GAMM|nr:GGDEF domain-containing protein [Simiduia curdlanivorans]MDN3638150.1 GGDEF domain-containing protein [Simiduia curdlanivorans]
MSEKDANYWRGKYRELLKEQERVTVKANPDVQIAIERLAQTAALLDKDLAQGLNPVFQQAKRKEWGRPGQLALLEQTLELFQRQIKITRERELLAVKQMSLALMEMPLDEASRKVCKNILSVYKRQSFANEWAPLVEAISSLKPRPLTAGEYPKEPGVLAKLFGASQRDEKSLSEEQLGEDSSSDDSNSTALNSDVDGDTSASLASANRAEQYDQDELSGLDRAEQIQAINQATQSSAAKQDLEDLMGLSGQLIRRGEDTDRELHEPAFSKISDRISMVLGDLLAQIEPQETVTDKAIAAKLRIDKGLNWYELVPTLEDIRDLVMALIISAKQDFQQYLLHLLEQINQLIAMTADTANSVMAREREMVIDIEVEVSALAQAAKSVNDVAELKQAVETRVQALAGVLSKRQSTDEAENKALREINSLQKQVNLLQKEAAEKQAELELNRQKARTDTLTGLANREAYNERIHHEIERFRRYQRPLTLIVCDIDHFKKFNDDYSHQVGDRVLKVISNAIEKQLRDVDFMARYGGEEFVVLMPETSAQDALIKMDRIRLAVAATKFKFKEHQLSITFSSGLAAIRDGDTASTLFARADKLLYEAKHNGRNCCVAEPVKEPASNS